MSLRKGQTNSGSIKKGEHRSLSTEFKKGVSISPKTQFKKEGIPWNKGKKGVQKAWNRGIPLSEEQKENIRQKLRKKDRDLLKVIRECQKMKCWTAEILKEQRYICKMCHQRGGKLAVHHIKPFSKIIRYNKIKSLKEALICAELWDKSNAQVVCWNCHYKIHIKEHGGFCNAGR